MPGDPQLAELLAKASISDVAPLIAQGIDRRDFGIVTSCFAPEAQATFQQHKASGRDAIIRHLRGGDLFTGSSRLVTSFHLVGQQSINLVGNHAKAETHVVKFERVAQLEGLVDRVQGTRWSDELVQHQGRWLIQRQQVSVDWTRADAVVAPPLQAIPVMSSPAEGWVLPTAPLDVRRLQNDESAAARYLQDREAIREVLTRWYDGCNVRDMDIIASCYTPDTEGEYRADWLLGVAGAIGKIQLIKNSLGFINLMGNYLVRIEGDVASAQTYYIQHSRRGAAGQVMDMRSGMRILYQMARTGEQWLIKRIVIGPDWSRLDALRETA